MDHALFTRLTQFSNVLQLELFPRLKESAGPIEGKMQLFVACCAMIPLERLVPAGRWNGRPSKDRVAIARAFVAKSVFGYVTTRQLIDVLKRDDTLRPLCGWARATQMPHESTFSRAFAEFAEMKLAAAAHEALVASTQQQRLIGHVCRDSTAIEAREAVVAAPGKERGRGSANKAAANKTAARKNNGKSRRGKKGKHVRQTQPERDQERLTRIEKQAKMADVSQMLAGIPDRCDWGAKANANGNTKYWRGYKLHLDVADGQIPLTAVLTSASVHDSQVAIPMMHMTTKKVTYLYDVADSAYDAAGIREVSRKLGHKPVIDYHTRAKQPTQLPVREKPQPEMSPAERERYKERTLVERVFGRLRDEFGAEFVRVKGAPKVLTHLMFGVLALTVDQTLRLAQ